MSKTVMPMWVCVVGMVLGAGEPGWAAPVGTAITYQGRLTDQGNPANNQAYDFIFRLYDTPVGMNLLGTDTAPNVTCQDGYFQAELDFGSGIFAGDARWLEIDVRQTGTVIYTTLSPRQELTPTPYALYALNGPGSSGFWAANGNDIYNSNSGNVGIGTTSPTGRLHVGTAAIYSDILFYDVGSGQNDLSVDPGSAYTDNIDRVYIVEVTDASSDPDKFKWSDDLGITWSAEQNMTTSWYNLNHGVRIKWDNPDGHADGGVSYGDTWTWVAISSNENALVVKEGKLVGIGTATPIWELEVANLSAGGGAESGVAADDARGAIAAYSSTFPFPFDHYAGRVSLFSDGATMGLDLRADGGAGDMRFYTGGPWPFNEKMRIASTGGIRMTSYRDDGLGSWEEGLYFANNSNGMGPWSHAGIWADGISGFNGALVFGVDGDDTNNLTGIQEAMRIDKSGNLGVGTTNPEAKLHSVSTKMDKPGVYGENLSTGYGVYGKSAFAGVRGEGQRAIYAKSDTMFGIFSDAPKNYFSGYIGIGTMNPQKPLDVAGITRTEVLEITGGSDLSEQFDICGGKERIKPGFVVSIDGKHPGKLEVSTRAYDCTVAGVVSGAGGINPGMYMGQRDSEADGKYPVALTGRVYCWCDASYGAIQPGDLITTSDTPGHAMKVTDRQKSQGAIIGKAMTALDKSTGLVLLLISLQ